MSPREVDIIRVMEIFVESKFDLKRFDYIFNIAEVFAIEKNQWTFHLKISQSPTFQHCFTVDKGEVYNFAETFSNDFLFSYIIS